jgi:hypothetical protein
VVSVLTIGPKVRGFIPDRRRLLRAIQVRSTPSFGVEVKPSAPCRKISQQRSFKVLKSYFVRQNSLPFSILPALLLDYSAGRIARELYWTNNDISSVCIMSPWFSMLI